MSIADKKRHPSSLIAAPVPTFVCKAPTLFSQNAALRDLLDSHLDSLSAEEQLDAQSVTEYGNTYEGMAGWAMDMGYDREDFRKAARTWKALVAQHKKLTALLAPINIDDIDTSED